MFFTLQSLARFGSTAACETSSPLRAMPLCSLDDSDAEIECPDDDIFDYCEPAAELAGPWSPPPDCAEEFAVKDPPEIPTPRSKESSVKLSPDSTPDSASSPASTTAPSVSPSASTAASSSPAAVLPVVPGPKRRKYSSKRAPRAADVVSAEEEAMNQKIAQFATNPCFIAQQKWPAGVKHQMCAKWRQWRFRWLAKIKREKNITIGERTWTWDSDEDFEAVRGRIEVAWWLCVSEDTSRPSADRGHAMAQAIKLLQFRGERQAIFQGPSVLLTYNGPWGLFTREAVGIDKTSQDVDGAVAKLAVFPPAVRLFKEMQQKVQELQERSVVSQFAVSLELCTKSFAAGAVRVHFHVWLLTSLKLLPRKEVIFRDSFPYLSEDACTRMALSGRDGGAKFVACFYVLAPKIGSIMSYGTKKPWVDFVVKPWWITTQYAAGKLSGESAASCYLRSVVGAEANLRQLEYVEARRRQSAQLQLQREVEIAIRSSQNKFRVVPEVELWASQYDTTRDRFRFLVLDGPSQMGKTRFAASLTSPEKFFYCDCSAVKQPDLRSFDSTLFDVLLFDELQAEAAIGIKKLLQASNDLCTLGSSPTNQHAYTVRLHRVKLVIASNHWREDLRCLPTPDQNWLRDNSVYVFVDRKLYETSNQ